MSSPMPNPFVVVIPTAEGAVAAYAPAVSAAPEPIEACCALTAPSALADGPERCSVQERPLAPITTVTHNPITHAVEVRPQVSAGGVEGHTLSRSLDSTPGPREEIDRFAHTVSEAAGIETGPADSIDCIGEIFVGARRLPQRELPPDFHARLLKAIESDEVFADPPPLFLQRARDV